MKKSFWVLTPILGTLIFVLLYIIASLLYPGGSQADKNSIGFCWGNNYWCNLLSEIAINGRHNPARPFALSAMFILCLTVSHFWYFFPEYTHLGKYGKLSIQLSGILSMIVAFFLFTRWHDMVINVSGFFGMIALVGTFVGLYKNKWFGLFWFGIFNLLIAIINKYVYCTKGFIVFLPVIQHISFVSFLLWFCCISFKLYRKEKSEYPM